MVHVIKQSVTLFWVSAIICENGEKPWLCALSEGERSLEKAKEAVENLRKNYRVLYAWIDVFDEDEEKKTIFHECYM